MHPTADTSLKSRQIAWRSKYTYLYQIKDNTGACKFSGRCQHHLKQAHTFKLSHHGQPMNLQRQETVTWYSLFLPTSWQETISDHTPYMDIPVPLHPLSVCPLLAGELWNSLWEVPYPDPPCSYHHIHQTTTISTTPLYMRHIWNWPRGKDDNDLWPWFSRCV